MNFFPAERHKQIYLQLSLNLRAIISQRLVKTTEGSRLAAVEILLGSPRVKDLIHKAKIAELKEAMEISTTIGMQTFDQHLFQLYQEGRISYDEALRNADSTNNLRLRIKLAESGSLTKEPEAFAQGQENGNGKASKEASGSGEDLTLQLDR